MTLFTVPISNGEQSSFRQTNWRSFESTDATTRHSDWVVHDQYTVTWGSQWEETLTGAQLCSANEKKVLTSAQLWPVTFFDQCTVTWGSLWEETLTGAQLCSANEKKVLTSAQLWPVTFFDQCMVTWGSLWEETLTGAQLCSANEKRLWLVRKKKKNRKFALMHIWSRNLRRGRGKGENGAQWNSRRWSAGGWQKMPYN